MTKTNHFNLMFDPKKSRGVVSTHYPEALSDAVVTAAQLQANLAAEKRDSDVILWCKLGDVRSNSNNIKPELSFRTKELSTSSDLPMTRSYLPELTAIEIDKITKIEVKDCNGQVIKNFNLYEVPVTYKNNGKEENTKLLISENKDIYALSAHALKHGMITEEQKTKIDYLTDIINPD